MNLLTYIIYALAEKLLQLSSVFWLFYNSIHKSLAPHPCHANIVTSLPLTTLVSSDANANTLPCLFDCRFGSDSTSHPLPRRRVEAGLAICVSPTEHDNSMMGPGGASEIVN
jgi:hypothetical protein